MTVFNVRKAAQIAAYFASREGGKINVLKLAKLIYIADRRNLEMYDFPISGDVYVSMDHGPVNSITLNYINGLASIQRDCWEEFVTDRDGYNVGVTREVTEEALDELSRAEYQTLELVWREFGTMNQYQIRDWTHENCPEWENPEGSSNPIPYERILKFLQKPHAEELAHKMEQDKEIRTAFHLE